jgi:HEAT repeat protein
VPIPGGLFLHVAWIGAAFLLLDVVGLIAFALLRHCRRQRHLIHLQELERIIEPTLRDLCSGAIDYPQGLDYLRSLNPTLGLLEELFTAYRDPPEPWIVVLERLCQDLGLVDLWQRCLVPMGPAPGHEGLWQRMLSGARAHPLAFVRRAEAAEYLGIIRHRASWRVLVEALSDPHVTVRSVAARALARIGEPESFAGLAQRLRSAALEPVPDISCGALKMALASFPLAEAPRLTGFLEDPAWQVRDLALRVVSATIERQAAARAGAAAGLIGLNPRLTDLLFARLASDESPEVRARVAEVAGRIEDVRSVPLLQGLVNDPEWFVRLHAVRALARQRAVLIGDLSRTLTDANWRVREAAAEALCALGQRGIGGLLDHFSTTEDRYSQDQIAEQLGKAGLLFALLESSSDPRRERERRFVQGMLRLGKGEALQAALATGTASTYPDALPDAFPSALDFAMHSPVARRVEIDGSESAPLPTVVLAGRC